MNNMYPEYNMMYPKMYDAGCGYPPAGHYKHEALVKTIQNCEAVCEHMTTFLKGKHDVQCRTKQLILLRDCADICGLTAKFVARGSMFSRDTAALCACICEACGKECAKFPDPESQNCAKVCLHCARECMAYAGSMM